MCGEMYRGATDGWCCEMGGWCVSRCSFCRRRGVARPIIAAIPSIQSTEFSYLYIHTSTPAQRYKTTVTMGRSAKVFKKPTKKEKAVSKITKAASKPLPPPPPPPEPVVKEQPETTASKAKKRRLMRAKVEKVSGQEWSYNCEVFS